MWFFNVHKQHVFISVWRCGLQVLLMYHGWQVWTSLSHLTAWNLAVTADRLEPRCSRHVPEKRHERTLAWRCSVQLVGLETEQQRAGKEFPRNNQIDVFFNHVCWNNNTKALVWQLRFRRLNWRMMSLSGPKHYLLNWMTMPSRRQSMITGRKLSRRPSRRKRRNQRRGKPRQRQPPFLAKLGTSQVLLPSKFHLRFPPVLLAAARSAQLCLQDLWSLMMWTMVTTKLFSMIKMRSCGILAKHMPLRALAIASKGCHGEGGIQAWNSCWMIRFKNILLLCICATLIKIKKLMHGQNDDSISMACHKNNRCRQHVTGMQQLRIIVTNANNIHDDQEPYSKNACERALENHGNYVTGINAFWVNHLRSPTPGIPLRRESVKELADFCGLRRTEAPAFLLELLEV